MQQSRIELEHTPLTKKQIIASRSFGQRIYHIDDLKEAMSLYVMDAISRLRDDNLLCGCLIGFVQSNPFDSSKPFYNKSLSLALSEPTDNLLVLSKLATAMIDAVCKGYSIQEMWRDSDVSRTKGKSCV